MAREVRKYTATIPANTPVSSPYAVPIVFPFRVVRTIEWSIPPGAQGVMGWQVAMGGVQVIPTGSDLWIVGDGTGGTFSLDGYPDSGAWQVLGYNTGVYAHSIFLVFHLDLIPTPKPPRTVVSPLAMMQLNDLSKAGPPVRGRS